MFGPRKSGLARQTEGCDEHGRGRTGDGQNSHGVIKEAQNYFPGSPRSSEEGRKGLIAHPVNPDLMRNAAAVKFNGRGQSPAGAGPVHPRQGVQSQRRTHDRKCPFSNLADAKSDPPDGLVTLEDMDSFVWVRPEVRAEVGFRERTRMDVLRQEGGGEFSSPRADIPSLQEVVGSWTKTGTLDVSFNGSLTAQPLALIKRLTRTGDGYHVITPASAMSRPATAI